MFTLNLLFNGMAGCLSILFNFLGWLFISFIGLIFGGFIGFMLVQILVILIIIGQNKEGKR